MCPPNRIPYLPNYLPSPRSVDSLHRLSSVKCIFSKRYCRILDKGSVCITCFRSKIPVQQSDLYELKTKHYIVDRVKIPTISCTFCLAPLTVIKSINECALCTVAYLDFLGQLETPIESPIVICTDFENAH